MNVSPKIKRKNIREKSMLLLIIRTILSSTLFGALQPHDGAYQPLDEASPTQLLKNLNKKLSKYLPSKITFLTGCMIKCFYIYFQFFKVTFLNMDIFNAINKIG